jgi:AcrR family transcriptional regulator
MPISTPNDRRATRTRRALLHAFVELVLERRYDAISVADIVARADVGRSTFYEHFRSKDDLLRHSMNWLLVMIAEAAGPNPDPDRLAMAVDHFWQNRRLARVVFSPPIAAQVRRTLTELIAERLGPADERAQARAVQIAAAQLALLESWSQGELAAPPELIADQLRAAARI